MPITRPTWKRIGISASVILIVLLAVPISLAPTMKRRLMEALSERFDSQVEAADISISMLPRPRVRGRGLVFRHKHRTDVPPLIQIASFSAEIGPLGLLRSPVRVSLVELDGLEINVPPGGMDMDDDGDDDPDEAEDKDDDPDRSPLVVEGLRSERAVLRILRRTPGKKPRVFEIRQLTMEQVGADVPWPFRAELTNPTPPGDISTEGTFGPWHAGDPAKTPLAATYRFDNANLGDFDGIQGVLTSTGEFSGVLERIAADGQTSVPAFALADVGNPVALEARFHSIIDGTNGNTLLQPVDATFLNTRIHATGGVVEREGEDGRTVTLDVVMDEAKLEDVLRLAVKGEPIMTGALKVKAALTIPPGDADVIQKLALDGSFDVAGGRFTKARTQAKLDAFSTKARGISDDTPDPVLSNFKGRFNMKDGVIRFSEVSFAMPGARVNVAGTYAMESEAVDFRGTVRLDARLSRLTTGVKAMLLRLFDGLFRDDDVTVIPITIDGQASQPKVKLDFGKVLTGG